MVGNIRQRSFAFGHAQTTRIVECTTRVEASINQEESPGKVHNDAGDWYQQENPPEYTPHVTPAV
jgi:hypothetical protein